MNADSEFERVKFSVVVWTKEQGMDSTTDIDMRPILNLVHSLIRKCNLYIFRETQQICATSRNFSRVKVLVYGFVLSL